MRSLVLTLTLLSVAVCSGRETDTNSAFRRWRAFWINVPGSDPHEYGVYHFRRRFQLGTRPPTFVVHVSGDNRYQLLVNGERVSSGPSRGDLTNWRYQTLDIASHLHGGANVLAAVVWNDGPRRSVAQISDQTGFLLEADDAANSVVDTNSSWLCMRDSAYAQQLLPPDQATGYYALGPNEKLDGARYPWRWEDVDYNDMAWAAAHELSRGASRFNRDAPNRWMLVPSEIPEEEQTPEPKPTIRKIEGLAGEVRFPQEPVTIPGHTTANLLLDQGHLTTAYLELSMSGGRNSLVSLRYAETLYVVKGKDKGNRNDVAGKTLFGPADTYLPDGGTNRNYRPLFWRTFRYLQLEIQTSDEPLTFQSLRSTFTAYPFESKATLQSSDEAGASDMQRILTTGWRTARLCAHESYMDCPAYEQLQYAGDARIQMMVSLYMTGDARLMKNGIALLNSSRTAEGATYSRAPSNLQQYIPPFSLWWIGMVHDYWMYVEDPAFVREMLGGVRSVLGFYTTYQKENGSLKRMPWWNFVDWVKEWSTGEPPAEKDGSSAAALDLQLLMAYQWAADLEKAFGSPSLAAEDSARAKRLQATILQTDWDTGRQLFADQPSHTSFSQHVNTLAVLAHVIEGQQAREVVQRLFSDPALAQASIYFRAYTNATLREVGLGDQYQEKLGPWRHMLSEGLTTWAEWDGPDVRSDCHAWGASPNFEYFRTMAGIESGSPGFHTVLIRPSLGQLDQLDATVPHPRGNISATFTRQGDKFQADIKLPPSITGTLVWKGQRRSLHEGENKLAF